MKALLRTWQEFEPKEIEKQLKVIGELQAECFNCHFLNVPQEAKSCPNCKVNFKYFAFRRQVNFNYLKKIKEQNPEIILIDFEDFKRAISHKEAKNILGF